VKATVKNVMTSRLQFASRHVGNSIASWMKSLWSDESTIEIFGHQSKRHVWQKLHCTSSEIHNPHCKAW